MDPQIDRRVVSRFVRTASVVLHDTPAGTGISWGWFAGSPPRMHIEAVCPASARARRWRVWLETMDHNRCVIPNRDTPDDVAHALAVEVEHERSAIEAAWVRHCGTRGWLGAAASVRTDRQLSVSCYVRTPNEFTRTVPLDPLRGRLGDARPEELRLTWVGALLVIDAGEPSTTTAVDLKRLLWGPPDRQ